MAATKYSINDSKCMVAAKNPKCFRNSKNYCCKSELLNTVVEKNIAAKHMTKT